ncbi:branched-chain amino acid ABC transporter permease [Sinorhizobium meliloti]|uniref:branched-chain amino acid ABC transporter permease n=1 Tax=Rhizobium meliloti TaxID=382 RepID=UPI000FD9465F|nr:branched-chain amino acid ABC transporter permease [Sinorhizobium meliloti]RVL84783.1 branched-chain amino acid ABC transporter permease [Sinorhizobium meliloti]
MTTLQDTVPETGPTASIITNPAVLRLALVLTGIVAAFGVVPAIATDYWLSSIIIPTIVMGLAGISLNLLQGYAGLVSLGSAAFMSVGVFSAYNLILRVPALPLPLVLVLAGLIAAGVGTFFGLPALRIKGFYLGASTLGAQFFFQWLFTNFPWFSNNSQSLTISAPRLEFWGYDLQSPVGRYLLVVTVTALLIGLAFLVVRSRLGREWMAIRDMETAASVLGIRLARRKLQVYAISSFFLGITGVLWGFAYLGTADAHTYNLDKSFQVLFIVLIGGTATIFGNFLGAAFIVLTPILLDHLVLSANIAYLSDQGAITNLQRVIFGAIIICILIKEPDGLSAWIRRGAGALGARLKT